MSQWDVLLQEPSQLGLLRLHEAETRLKQATKQLDACTVNLGHSRAGAPIELLRIGAGTQRSFWYAGPHANEPVVVLHYQPKLHLPTGEVTGVEALVRWQHPTRGLLFPDALLALAEQAGLMGRVTDLVVLQAVHDAQRWRQEFPRLTVSVNVSASNLQDLDLPNRVERSLAQGGLPPGALMLEITENVLIVDPERALEVLRRLRSLGVTLSVDDFGTGFCSLEYIRELPVQELKLDRSFVTNLLSDARSGAIVRNTIDLTKQLGLTMVAEGVEDAETLEALRRWGCDLAQGYHLTRPLPGEQLLTWLRDTRGTFGAAHSGTAFDILPRRPLESGSRPRR